MYKIDWKRKLTSRKLWLAVAGFVSGLMIAFGRSESEASTVTGLILQAASILAYCIGEGLADSKDVSHTYVWDYLDDFEDEEDEIE